MIPERSSLPPRRRPNAPMQHRYPTVSMRTVLFYPASVTAFFASRTARRNSLGPNYVPLGPNRQGLAFGKDLNKAAARAALRRAQMWRGWVNYNSDKQMAGAPGFEPGNGGIKIRCLTTWLRPNCTEESRPGQSRRRWRGPYMRRPARSTSDGVIIPRRRCAFRSLR